MRAVSVVGGVGGAVLLTGLDWPSESDSLVVVPEGPPVELKVTRRQYPRHPGPNYPAFARCAVRIYVDETGRPYHADARGCVAPFDGVAEKAFAGWRFEPHVVDGVPARATTTVAVTFLMRGMKPPPPPNCNWWLVVAPTGDIALGPIEPPRHCAAWFAEKVSAGVPLEGAWGSCSLSWDSESPGIDASGCPLADRSIGVDIVQRSMFGRAARTTVVIDMPPGGTPPGP